jgi:hypothetical protein
MSPAVCTPLGTADRTMEHPRRERLEGQRALEKSPRSACAVVIMQTPTSEVWATFLVDRHAFATPSLTTSLRRSNRAVMRKDGGCYCFDTATKCTRHTSIKHRRMFLRHLYSSTKVDHLRETRIQLRCRCIAPFISPTSRDWPGSLFIAGSRRRT